MINQCIDCFELFHRKLPVPVSIKVHFINEKNACGAQVSVIHYNERRVHVKQVYWPLRVSSRPWNRNGVAPSLKFLISSPAGYQYFHFTDTGRKLAITIKIM